MPSPPTLSPISTLRAWPVIRLLLFVTVWLSWSTVSPAAWQDDIGLTKLRETLGDQMLTGQGVFISQVEALQGQIDPHKYFPDPNSPHFDASLDPLGVEPTFVNGSAGAHPSPTTSSHALHSVAKFYYGDQIGLAPGAEYNRHVRSERLLNDFSELRWQWMQ